ncbi:MAG: ABC transporter permease [Desulfobacterales bacterium]|nr:MAG: ABC transporter permease [Desulfobacterales bacterium]
MLKAVRIFFMLKSLWAVLGALLIGGILITVSGSNPLTAYRELFKGAFFDYYGFANTLVKMSPILLAGLAVLLPLRVGQFNIGAEGQIYLGALFATVAALYLPEMTGWLHILICILAGMFGGAVWGAIPGYLKAFHGINEVIITLLMNYVGIDLISYFVSGPMMAEGAPYPYSPEIREALWLPILMPRTDAHLGVGVGLVFALVLIIVFRYTSFGFALDTVGKNPTAARYAGISVRRSIFLTMTLGGALAGLAGTLEVLGLKYRLFHQFSAGYGFDGIVVAFLAAGSPIWMPVAAIFLSGLKAGANIMQRAVGVETTVVEAIKGLVVIFIAAGLAIRYNESFWARVLKRRQVVAAELKTAAGPKEE